MGFAEDLSTWQKDVQDSLDEMSAEEEDVEETEVAEAEEETEE